QHDFARQNLWHRASVGKKALKAFLSVKKRTQSAFARPMVSVCPLPEGLQRLDQKAVDCKYREPPPSVCRRARFVVVDQEFGSAGEASSNPSFEDVDGTFPVILL